jgi:lipopolysaccharide export LptBFGC system permease protein LptF
MFKIIDRYVSGQVISTVTWSVGMLSLMLVVGNALRDLLNLLISHQLPVSYILTFMLSAYGSICISLPCQK